MEGTPEGGTVVLVATPSSPEAVSTSSDVSGEIAAVAASQQATAAQIGLVELQSLVERIAERFGLEISALRERMDTLTALIISAVEDMETEETELEEVEEVPVEPEGEIIELSDTPEEETQEEDQRNPDVSRGDESKQGESGNTESNRGVDATESESRKRSTSPARKSGGPFRR